MSAINLAGPLGFGLSFKGSVASDFALASGSRDTALTIRLTRFPITAISRSPDHPIILAGPLGFELEPLSRRLSLLAKS